MLNELFINSNEELNKFYEEFGNFIFNPPTSFIIVNIQNVDKMNEESLLKVEILLAQGRSIKNLKINCFFSIKIQRIIDNMY